jgi:hypothetical protein
VTQEPTLLFKEQGQTEQEANQGAIGRHMEGFSLRRRGSGRPQLRRGLEVGGRLDDGGRLGVVVALLEDLQLADEGRVGAESVRRGFAGRQA